MRHDELMGLFGRVGKLEKRLAALEAKAQPTANMDAGKAGATLKRPKDLSGLPPNVVAALEMAGYTTPALLYGMSASELTQIPGIGKASARAIRSYLK